jgi:hypothetical protein
MRHFTPQNRHEIRDAQPGTWATVPSSDFETFDPMRHFTPQNRHEIRDAQPGTWATLLSSDFETFSELSRNGFYLVEMSGEVWTLRRCA